MQSVNNNPIKSITINKSQCSNKNRIFKIQTSCCSVMYKHRPGARVRSVSKYPRSAASPTCSFLGGGRSDGQHIIKLYCQGEHTQLLPAFFCDFNDTLRVWFSGLFFFIFTSCGLYDTKTGKIFLQYFPSGLFIKTLVHYETPSFRVKVGPFPCNYPGNKFTISVPKGMATHYGKSFEEGMFRGDEEEQN